MSFIHKIRRSANRTFHLGQMKLDSFLSPSSQNLAWPHLLYIIGLPKSGTNWLSQLLEEVPGYKPAYIYDPDECSQLHNICNDIFSHLPHNLHYVMKLHTECAPRNVKVLDQFDLRPVIMYRDLRDQCVSRYFHVLNDPTHRHHAQYNSTPKEEAMMHNIDITIGYYLGWVENWRSIMAQQPSRFLEVKYETLRQNPALTLQNVLEFFKIDLSQSEVENIVQKVSARTKFDIKENLSKHKGTARKGIVGDWRNHFTEQQVQLFKEKCGQHLIDLGYEKDLNWTLDH